MSQPLIDNLPLIAAAPDGVKALRGLILDLAVRGKLVPQDPKDAPASELLKRIAEEKARLANGRGNRAQSRVSPLVLGEPPFSIAPSWVWVSFGDVVISRDGERIPVSREERERREKTYDYYGASGVIDKIDGYLFDKPLLLIGEDGANLINRSTPIAFIARGKYWVNNHAHVLDGLCEDFLRYLELFINATNLEPYVTGTAQPKMNQAKMNSIPVALPPLAEQRRIVAKVDELMALCDRLEAQQADAEAVHATLVKTLLDTLTQSQDANDFAVNWHRLSQHFPTIFTTEASVDALKQTMLTLAISGMLSSRASGDVPASVLLESISAEKERQIEAGNIRRQSALMREPNGIGNAPLPEAWAWISIDDAFHVSGGIQKTPARQPRRNSYPYVGVGNVYRGYLDLRSISQFELMDGELEKFRLETWDILVVEGNGSANEIGRCAVWNNDIPQCVHQNHIIRCRPVDKNVVPYVQLYLNSPQGIEVMKALAVTSSGLYNLSVGKIRSIWLPLPPLAEQRRIVAKVDELLALCDTLKAQIADSRKVQRLLATALIDQTLAA